MLRAAGVTEILWCRELAVVGRAAATLLPSESENLSSVSVDDEGGLREAAKGGAWLGAAALLCVLELLELHTHTECYKHLGVQWNGP